MSKDTAEVANDKPVPSRREGALRHTKGGKEPKRQQTQSLKRHSPKEENNSSPKSADEQEDQREAWLMRKHYG